MEHLLRLFERHFHTPPDRVEPLHGNLGGSERRLVRLYRAGQPIIGVQHTVAEENAAFVAFTRHFRRHGLPVPEIYAEDLGHGVYLEEDLGDTTLFQFLAANRIGEQVGNAVVEAYRAVIAMLPRFQFEAGRDLDYSVAYPRQAFDRRAIHWDLSSFKYYFLKPSGTDFNEDALEEDFNRLTAFLLRAEGLDHFLYRDFQSRNIMLRDGNPFFIDYQNGRRGAPHYDLASLLYDAKADLTPAFRQTLLDDYLGRLEACGIAPSAFMPHFYAYVYVRIMQAMGAYGFRGFFERKPLFLQSVPYALRNIRWLLDHVGIPIHVPELMHVFETLASREPLAETPADTVAAPLRVRIFSFSFRQKPPVDETGNGGGFIFDVRSLPNPGREERFRTMTGKDVAVKEYLAREDAVRDYLTHVFALVDSSVTHYRRRGFQNLQVAFGCTGGQHRSVYLAEQLGGHLNGQPGVEVTVTHLEESLWPK